MDKIKKKKLTNLIVLGSNSFAGSAFIDFALKKKFKIIGISRSKEKSYYELKYKKNKLYKKNFQFYKCDINKNQKKIFNLIKNSYKPTIIDFAGQGMVAESWEYPDQWFKTNVLSKIKLIEKIKYLKIKKYIRISTPEVYGSSTKKISENGIHNPSTPYALSHSAIDKYLELQYKQFKFPAMILRFSNFYGEYQPLYRIIPKTIISILKRKKINLHGGGVSSRSFIYIDDFSDAILKAIKTTIHEMLIFNISSNEIITIRNLVNLICKKMKVNFNDVVKNSKDRRGKDKIYFMNNQKSKFFLKWKNNTKLNDGLDKTIKWYISNFKKIKNFSEYYMHKN